MISMIRRGGKTAAEAEVVYFTLYEECNIIASIYLSRQSVFLSLMANI